MIRLLVLFQLTFVVVFSCKCSTVSPRDTFCQAKWVSHVKVMDKRTSSDRSTVVYTVEHIDVYKNMTDPLGTEIVTPESSAACGVTDLKTGKEYLLAGTVANGSELRIVSCLFFNVKDDPTPIIGALAFEKVAEDLRSKLEAADFGGCP
ncbi:NTR domain-containing protein [Aphelenchoides besseyi]|nr:NTR domain-containing protein [Aphelenchoides besseyi]